MSYSFFQVKNFILATAIASMPLLTHAKTDTKTIEENPKSEIAREEYSTVKVVARKNETVPVNFPSSAQVISDAYIKERQYTDIERILTAVPSVQIRSEDGLGLRPNIGIRGSRLERTANITLMEDGTLIAPAAYSAPAAYYFPEALRMSEFEVYKGGSSVQYGPRTTSGILNMVTQPIDGKSSVMASIGSFNERIVNTKVSHKGENAGFLFVATNKKTDGFRKIDGTSLSNANNPKTAGAEQTDYMLKMSFNTDKDALIYQQLDIKLAEQNHNSDQSYLGLTAEDFAKNPHRQYSASQMDNIDAKHSQKEIKHTIEVENLSVATKLYHNTFQRNWYKLGKINGRGLADVLRSPSGNSNEFSFLTGTVNATNGELSVKGNNRYYVSEGIQTDASYILTGNKVSHKIDAGLRLHSDSEDRHQGADKFNMIDGQMVMHSRGIKGNSSSNNRLSSATALAGYLKDTITIGNLTVVPGVRYENIDFTDQRWNNPDRTNENRNNKKTVTAFVPSLSGSYQLTENYAIFGGIHEGFAPPSPSSGKDVENEKSMNYELGYRFKNDATKTFLEISGYFNNYSNLLGTDMLAGAGAGTGAQFNGGKVHAYGIEVIAGKTFSQNMFEFPVMLAYTFTDAKFQNTFTENGIQEWGSVQKGDRLPYISKHQFTLNTGVKYQKIGVNLLTRFVGSSYADAQGIDKVPSYMIFDIIGNYQVNESLTVFVALDNLTNKTYLTGFNPYGLRGGKPRTFKVGGVYNF